MGRINKYVLGFISLLILQSSLVQAGEQGHYFPGVTNIRDLSMPPKGVYLANYNFHYDADTFNLASGEELDHLSASASAARSISLGGQSVPLTLTGTVNADVGIEFSATMHQPTLVWITEHKLWGADYGLMIGLPFGSMEGKVEADVTGAGTLTIGEVTETITASRHIEREADKSGIGDLYVAPVFLGWHGAEYDASVNYGFYAPTGEYDSQDLLNIGMGFWTHQWQANFIYYPPIIQPKATALMVQTTYELHGDKEGKDVTPGQDITIEYGLSQYLATWLEVGVFGYHLWQVSDDDGSDATSTVEDSTNGAGVQLSVWPIEKKLYISGRFAMEYETEDRFEGWMATINTVYIF